MAEDNSVLIVAEVAEGRLLGITQELLGVGRKLANDLGVKLSAVLPGSGVAGLAKEVVACGADRVYVMDAPVLKDYTADAYVAAIQKLCAEAKPQIVLMGQTSVGRDLAPRLAFRLGTAASMDCVELAIDPQSKQLLQTKPVFGGNARAVFVTQSHPQIATVRVKAMAPSERDDSRQGEVVSVAADVPASAVRVKVLNRVKEEVAGIKLEDAEVVVCGGRGIGSPENFKMLEELAKMLGAAMGATRPPCDNGWVPTTLQIGLTGKIVSPNLYVAVALSGSSQHMAGCSGSKNIVAINKDPEANIFKEARFGVVGDYKQVLPALTQKLKELLAT